MMVTNTKQFLNEKMELIFKDFQKDIFRTGYLCKLKDFTFSGSHLPNYKDEMVQKYYLLKYLPAYLTEYYYIYNQIFDKNFLNEKYSILSLGCGCGVDLWGLNLVKERKTLKYPTSYTGVDVLNWKYSEFSKMNGYFKNSDILDIKNIDGDYNIFMFPKSISEFDNFTFEHLKSLFINKRFDKKRMVLVAAIRRSRTYQDLQRFDQVIDIFRKKHGYSIADSTMEARGDNAPYIFQIADGIKYPDEPIDYIKNLHTQCKKYKLTNKNCETSCENLLSRFPILKTSQMAFKIVYLEK